MRDIIFRGKRLDNGEWAEGYYFANDNGSFIFVWPYHSNFFGGEVMVKVDPETVGEYTGMTDRTGTRIFVGDIVQVGDERVLIVWQETRFVPLKKNKRPMTWFLVSTTGKIIGNEFDDPELLKGEPPCSQPSKP